MFGLILQILVFSFFAILLWRWWANQITVEKTLSRFSADSFTPYVLSNDHHENNDNSCTIKTLVQCKVEDSLACNDCRELYAKCVEFPNEVVTDEGTIPPTEPGFGFCLVVSGQSKTCNPNTSTFMLYKRTENSPYAWGCKCLYPGLVNQSSLFQDCDVELACGPQGHLKDGILKTNPMLDECVCESSMQFSLKTDQGPMCKTFNLFQWDQDPLSVFPTLELNHEKNKIDDSVAKYFNYPAKRKILPLNLLVYYKSHVMDVLSLELGTERFADSALELGNTIDHKDARVGHYLNSYINEDALSSFAPKGKRQFVPTARENYIPPMKKSKLNNYLVMAAHNNVHSNAKFHLGPQKKVASETVSNLRVNPSDQYWQFSGFLTQVITDNCLAQQNLHQLENGWTQDQLTKFQISNFGYPGIMHQIPGESYLNQGYYYRVFNEERHDVYQYWAANKHIAAEPFRKERIDVNNPEYEENISSVDYTGHKVYWQKWNDVYGVDRPFSNVIWGSYWGRLKNLQGAMPQNVEIRCRSGTSKVSQDGFGPDSLVRWPHGEARIGATNQFQPKIQGGFGSPNKWASASRSLHRSQRALAERNADLKSSLNRETICFNYVLGKDYDGTLKDFADIANSNLGQLKLEQNKQKQFEQFEQSKQFQTVLDFNEPVFFTNQLGLANEFQDCAATQFGFRKRQTIDNLPIDFRPKRVSTKQHYAQLYFEGTIFDLFTEYPFTEFLKVNGGASFKLVKNEAIGSFGKVGLGNFPIRHILENLKLKPNSQLKIEQTEQIKLKIAQTESRSEKFNSLEQRSEKPVEQILEMQNSKNFLNRILRPIQTRDGEIILVWNAINFDNLTKKQIRQRYDNLTKKEYSHLASFAHQHFRKTSDIDLIHFIHELLTIFKQLS